jgi:hypothetical protein
MFTISGNVGIANAILSFTDGSINADQNGNFSITVSPGFTDDITPSLTGYSFNPTSISYNNVQNNYSKQNFVATRSRNINPDDQGQIGVDK